MSRSDRRHPATVVGCRHRSLPMPRPLLGLLMATLPLPALTDLAQRLSDSPMSDEEVEDAIAELVDDLIDWTTIERGSLGALLEEVDGPIAEAVAREIIRRIGSRDERADRLEARAGQLEARAAGMDGSHPRAAGRLRSRADRLRDRAAELRS